MKLSKKLKNDAWSGPVLLSFENEAQKTKICFFNY